jgi:hypothetical protein
MVNQLARERLCTFLQSLPSTLDTSLVQPRVFHTTQSRDATDVSGRDATQRVNRTGLQSELPGILLSRVPRHQEEREVQTCYQPTSSQPVDRGPNLQDGDSSFNLGRGDSRRLGHIIRPHRRILPHTSSTLVSEVSEVRDQRPSFPVSSASIRPSDSSTHLYQDASSDGYTSSLDGHLTPPLHRRHPSQSTESRTTDDLGCRSHQDPNSHGIQDQSTEVYVKSYTRLRIHRSQVSHSPWPDETTRRENLQDPRPDSSDQELRPSSSQTLDVTTGSTRFGRKTGPFRETSHSTSTDLPSLSVPMGSTSAALSSSTRCEMLFSTGMVVQSEPLVSGTIPRPFSTGPHIIHGRFPDELGCTRERQLPLRSMVTSRDSSLDQPARTASSDPSHSSSTSNLEKPEAYDSLGQLVDSGLHQQDGRNSKRPIVRTYTSTVSSSPVSSSNSTSQTHSRATQQTGRHPVEISSDSQHRVDFVDACLQTSPQPLGISDSGSNGHGVDDQTSSLRVSISRSQGSGGRRNVLRLDRSGHVRLSPVAHDRSSSPETEIRPLHSDSDHSLLAESSLVSRSTRPTGRASQNTPSTSRSTDHASQRSSAQEHRSSFSARMSTIIDAAVNQGFSTEVSERIARGRHVNSTQVIYDSKWLKFEAWCSNREISPSSASLGNLADFLLYLFKTLKLSYSTITGYRSSINSVWRAMGRSDVESHAIHQLLDSFKFDRPRTLVVLPKWDLALVLRVLSKPPYEPIGSIDFKNLSAKTVFLLLLATSRRRGDIHAIDPKRVIFKSNYAILEPLPGYIPKVRANAEREARYQPMVVRSLTTITNDQAELTLCPVRALRAYEKVASERVPDRAQFFISTRADKRLVKKNTISAWVVKLIRSAYSSATSEDCRLAQASVHEVRAIATSLAYQATYALDDILKAATWSNPTTFIDHYLRDVSGLQGRLHVLAPCVIAGKTLR